MQTDTDTRYNNVSVPLDTSASRDEIVYRQTDMDARYNPVIESLNKSAPVLMKAYIHTHAHRDTHFTVLYLSLLTRQHLFLMKLYNAVSESLDTSAPLLDETVQCCI